MAILQARDFIQECHERTDVGQKYSGHVRIRRPAEQSRSHNFRIADV